uniref:Uncharacterized protein n=1 Tax=Anopheles farauti TaxID=69004 RepID=A0A182QKD3_9DIPT
MQTAHLHDVRREELVEVEGGIAVYQHQRRALLQQLNVCQISTFEYTLHSLLLIGHENLLPVEHIEPPVDRVLDPLDEVHPRLEARRWMGQVGGVERDVRQVLRVRRHVVRRDGHQRRIVEVLQEAEQKLAHREIVYHQIEPERFRICAQLPYDVLVLENAASRLVELVHVVDVPERVLLIEPNSAWPGDGVEETSYIRISQSRNW